MPRRFPRPFKVGVVSEDPRLTRLVRRHYQEHGIEVSGIEDVAYLSDDSLDLILFDLAGRNDRAALALLHESQEAPILAMSVEVDVAASDAIAELLRVGAAGVIGRPFRLDAFDSYIDALRDRTREQKTARPKQPYIYHDLVLDFETSAVTLSGQWVRLSPLQYRVLECLARNAGAVVTPRQLSDAVWGADYDASDELIRSHVRNIRRLIGDSAKAPRFLRTESHVGYWLPRGGSRAFPNYLLESAAFREVLDDSLDACIHALGTDMGNIQLLDEVNRALIIASQRGFEAEFLEHFQTVAVGDGSVCSRALERGERVVIEDITQDPTSSLTSR